MASELTPTSAAVCWTESVIGVPFTIYNVEITEVNSDPEAKLRRFNSSSVGAIPNLDCSTGLTVNFAGCVMVSVVLMILYLFLFQVTGLAPDTCYRFRVFYSNSQGLGQPSSPSPEYCTASCPKDSVCSSNVATKGVQDSPFILSYQLYDHNDIQSVEV